MMKFSKVFAICLLACCLSACQSPAGQGKEEGTTTTSAVTEQSTGVSTSESTKYSAPADYRLDESYGEWFLSKPEWPNTEKDKLPVVRLSEQYRNYQLKTPGSVSKTVGDVTVTVNFFKETYRFGEALQAKITVENNSEQTFREHWHTNGCEILNNQGTVVARYYPFLTIQATSANGAEKYVEIPAWGTQVYEYMFFIDDSFVTDQLLFFRYRGIGTSTQAQKNEYVIEVPLEVIPG